MRPCSSTCSCCVAMPDPSVWQTIGPFFPTLLAEASCTDLTELRGKPARGTRITLSGQILERDRQPVRNAVVEIWQPDADGLFAHPADPRAASADRHFLGWGAAPPMPMAGTGFAPSCRDAAPTTRAARGCRIST